MRVGSLGISGISKSSMSVKCFSVAVARSSSWGTGVAGKLGNLLVGWFVAVGLGSWGGGG